MLIGLGSWGLKRASICSNTSWATSATPLESTRATAFDGLNEQVGLVSWVIPGTIDSNTLSHIRDEVAGLPGGCKSLNVRNIKLVIPRVQVFSKSRLCGGNGGFPGDASSHKWAVEHKLEEDKEDLIKTPLIKSECPTASAWSAKTSANISLYWASR